MVQLKVIREEGACTSPKQHGHHNPAEVKETFPFLPVPPQEEG